MQHVTAVPWDQLSTAFRETIVLTLALDFAHVWIDSLCIIQDDFRDWEYEAPKMGMIYRNASIVFSAHSSELYLQKVPLISLLDLNRMECPPVFCRQKMNHRLFYIEPIDNESWFGRAWCMQEQILARRILHLGNMWEETILECNTCIKCECSRITDEIGPKHPNRVTLKTDFSISMEDAENNASLTAARHTVWKQYIDICENYTARGLTVSSDTLPAVSSLMNTLAPYLGDCYAGIWDHNILLNLQWEIVDTGRSFRHENYVAPSFSWASRSGAVIWYLTMDNIPTAQSHEFATILSNSCTLAGQDPFGKVSGGSIKLRGHVTQMKMDSRVMYSPDGSLKMAKEETDCVFCTLDAMQDVENLQVPITVTCLDIMRDKVVGREGKKYVSGLVLLPVTQLAGHYRRIGISTMLEEHFKNSPIQEITIV